MSFPEPFRGLLRSVVVVNLDVVGSLGLSCRFDSFNFLDQMFVTTAVPVAICALLGALYMLLRIRERATERERAAAGMRLLNVYVVPKSLQGAFTDLELSSIRRTFAEFDKDGSGSITKPELTQVLVNLNQDLTADAIDAMFDRQDTDKSGTIDFAEYLAALHESRHEGVVSDFAVGAQKLENALNKGGGSQVVFQCFLLLTFLVLISASTAVFNTLRCHVFDEAEGGSQSFLFVDYSVDCQSARYQMYRSYAIIMVCIYPVGGDHYSGMLESSHHIPR